jgi:hypothetical protein
MKRQPINELIDVIRSKRDELLANGEPTSRDVSDTVIRENEELIREHGFLLGCRTIRALTVALMKEVVDVSNAQQFALPFDFKDLPGAITFIKDGKTHYVLTYRAQEEHLASYQQILRDQIRADTKKLRAAEKLHDMLKPIFDQNPGISVREACALLSKAA